jgi:hypothetical protein
MAAEGEAVVVCIAVSLAARTVGSTGSWIPCRRTANGLRAGPVEGRAASQADYHGLASTAIRPDT